MYDLSGLPSYELRADGLHGRSYTLFAGRERDRRVYGEWRLLRQLAPDEVATLRGAMDGAPPENARVLLDAVHDGRAVAIAVRLMKCETTGEYYAVLAAERPGARDPA